MQILLTIAYDGTNYAGWQRQENAVAVQEKIETALENLLLREKISCEKNLREKTSCEKNLREKTSCEKISREKISCEKNLREKNSCEKISCEEISQKIILRAASRTDAGVHALGQRASFFAPQNFKIPVEKLPAVLRGFLPPDICVTHAETVSDDFNPQFDAKQKTYRYRIHTAQNPLLSRYSAFVPRDLDAKKMQAAAKFFVGRHDFAAFCATGSSAKTTVREIFDCVVRGAHAFEIEITGGGFLYNMVRIIAGTLVYVGLGKISAEEIPEIIASKNRAKAGKTMPPHGLTLAEILY